MSWMDELLSTQAPWMWFLAAFLGGLALNLTPCVYPMIPVTVAFFSGQAPGRLGYTLWLGLLYVLGMALMYALLGSLVSQTGALLGSWLQQPAVLLAVAGLVVALALGMFGLYELRPPAWLTRRLGRASSGSLGAFGMGLTVGVIAAPCIGPFVLGMLLFVGRLADPALGFWLLLTLGLGMGLPYVLLGVWANRLASWPKAGPWMVWIKRALGIVLLGLALYLIKPLLPVPTPSASAGIRWQPYRPEALAQAAHEGRPVIVDVFADWCLPCVELDHVTFRHPDVVKRVEGLAALRVDATREIPPEAESLLERYDVYGVPTVLLFDADGRERPELRVQGFVPPKELLARLDRLHQENNHGPVHRP